MKTLILLSLLASSSLFAQVIPYNNQECLPDLEHSFQIFSGGTVSLTKGYKEIKIDAQGMVGFMQTFLSQIENAFAATPDIMTLSNLKPLCIGMYHDAQGANAIAVNSDNIFFGVNLLEEMQSDWGVDAESGIKTILAHEYAHIIQNRMELKFNYVTPMLSTKMKELQADCLAGALLAFHFPKAKTIIETDKLMRVIADHHIVGDHGTFEQRRFAVFQGMKETLKLMMKGKTVKTTSSKMLMNACSEYYAPRA